MVVGNHDANAGRHVARIHFAGHAANTLAAVFLSERVWFTVESGMATDELSVVVITADESFHAKLRRIADERKWRLMRAESIEEAEMPIGRKPTPLVVYESDAGNGNWRFALRRLHALPPHPCVLLASAVADENLLREVMRNSGYDILPKAASGENLARALNFAWFWTLTWQCSRQ
jgi:hypothetical protein